MRIGVLTTSYPRSVEDDAGIFVQRLVQGYDTCGAQGVVIVPHDSSEPLREEYGRFRIERYRYGVFTRGKVAFGAGMLPNLRARPSLVFQLPLLLIGMVYRAVRVSADVDIFHANWSVAAVAAWIVSLITGAPYMITLRGEDVRLSRVRAFRLLLTWVMRRAHCVVSVNEHFLAEVGARFSLPDDRLCCIPNGVECEPASEASIAMACERFQLQQGERYLLFVGTIVPRKRVPLLLQLLREPKLSGYTLLLAGRIDDAECVAAIQREVAAHEIGARVRILGAVPPPLVPALLRLSVCYVSASEFEGRPNAVLEAIASGVPVCVSAIPSHTEIVNKSAGFLFEENTLGAAATYISALPLERMPGKPAGSNSWESCAAQYISRAGNADRR